MPMGQDVLFDIPEDNIEAFISNKKEGSAYRIVDDKVKARASAVWFTNLDHEKRHEELIPYETYSPEKYPSYDNFDAINVDKTKEIPANYAGKMGVPVSFLDKYSPNQFEIVGIDRELVKDQSGKVSRFRVYSESCKIRNNVLTRF